MQKKKGNEGKGKPSTGINGAGEQVKPGRMKLTKQNPSTC